MAIHAFAPVVVQESPWAAAPGRFVSSVVLQMTPLSRDDVYLDFHRPDGTRALRSLQPVPGRGPKVVDLPSLRELPAGRYSLVIYGRAELTSVVTLAAEQPALAGSYACCSPPSYGRTVAVPAVFKR